MFWMQLGTFYSLEMSDQACKKHDCRSKLA